MTSTTNSTSKSLTGSITDLNLDLAGTYYKKSSFADLRLDPAAPAEPLSSTSTKSSSNWKSEALQEDLATSTTTTKTVDTNTVLTASIETNGKGAAKKATDPPPPAPQPERLLRGADPWDNSRVADLLSSGKIQAGWLPDIRATALTHLQIQNSQQREMLRFSNAIANTGANNWQVRRGSLISDPQQIAYALSLGLNPDELAATGQELLNDQGQIAAVIADAGLSEYHPEHLHFHIGETASFGVERLNQSNGTWDPITGLEVVKTTFCLIDVNQIQQVPGSDPDHYEVIKSPANANVYNDCYADVQGIQDGWVDRYNHSLQGQEVDVTGLEAGTYRIISTVNPSGWFLESNYSNNVSWTAFDLSRDSNGNPKLSTIPGATGGIWFDQSSNGMG